ncbi:MAG TPA: hypothetical protein VMO26_30085 [Vicinamibacterales bacterium]|nr:hypothetical protein [Vicinamibacterales bacterium]
MSYMRGPFYVWRDDTSIHIWAADGDDGWRESVWAAHHLDNADGGAPSGTKIPLDTLDERAVMRLAQLIEDGRVAAAINRALERHRGNFGCNALDQLATSLKALVTQASRGEE